MTNCEELRQNAAAYALGALTEDEQAEFERHIAECGLEHEIELFSEVASRLSQAAPSVEPPPGLKDKILLAATAESASQTVAAAERRPTPTWTQRLQRFGAPAYGAAAVALIAIGALIGWGAASLSGGDSATELNHFRRDPEGDWLRVETVLGEDGLMLSVGNLDTLPGQSIYQFWAIREERWVPIGEFDTDSEGKWSGYFQFSLQEGDSVAITVEPESGAETPGSDPEISSRI